MLSPYNLLLYSGGQQVTNHRLHLELSKMVGTKRSKSFVYIPYCKDDSNLFYHRAVKRYREFGFSKFQKLPADERHTKDELKKALQSDVIYLAGGNTFYMLHHLRESGLIKPLQEFARRGGILAGLSAGALILSPNIRMAGYPKSTADKNEVKLKNLKSLNLCKFEFYPHYYRSAKIDKELHSYAKRHQTTVVAATDGSGLSFYQNQMRIFGEVVFFHGKK